MVYSVGLYIRLSKEDKDNFLSESVVNQKSLLRQYAIENNLEIFDYYIDDGYSGTNFDRPEFGRLINDIENKRINMVITKDMSRLGRDYIETCNLIEKYFPLNGVRYIAITDNIDTYLDNSNNEITPFKAIMNDYYAKDISKKIRSSLIAKKREGKWVSGRCPFGYDRDSKDKNHLVINLEKAIVVRDIYKMYLDGMSIYAITKKLNDNSVKTPSEYYDFKWNGKSSFNRNWNSKTVKDILSNEVYIGNLVQNKRSKINYKINKVVYNDKDKYIVVSNTHEAIIDKDVFYNVQKLLSKNKKRCDKLEDYLLDGIIYCGECHKRILINSRRKKDGNCYTICSGYRKNKGCTIHSNNYDKLEKAVVEKIYNYVVSNINVEEIKKKCLWKIELLNKKNSKKSCNFFDKEVLSKEILKLEDSLDKIYIDKVNGYIDCRQYERVKSKIDKKIKCLQNEISLLSEVIVDNKKNSIIDYVDNYFQHLKITRNVIIMVVEKIYLYQDGKIDVIIK